MKLKKYKKNKISNYFVLTLIILILSWSMTIYIIKYFSLKTEQILLPLAVSKTRKIVTEAINDSTKDIIFEEDLFEIIKNNENEIKMINYDSLAVTKLINKITYNIQNMIICMENSNDKNVVAEIPFGLISDTIMLNNLGPKIKIKLEFVGDVMTVIETKVKPYGINNAYVEMGVNIEVNARIILPFVSEKVTITNTIPISMNIVQGRIPNTLLSSYK